MENVEEAIVDILKSKYTGLWKKRNQNHKHQKNANLQWGTLAPIRIATTKMWTGTKKYLHILQPVCGEVK